MVKYDQSFTRCSITQSDDAFVLQGVEGVSGPTGIIGPSGHLVRISSSVSCAELHEPPVCFLAMMERSSVFFSLHQGAKGDRGSQGEMVRGAV